MNWYKAAVSDELAADLAIKERLGGKTVLFEVDGGVMTGKVIGSRFKNYSGQSFSSPLLKIKADDGEEYWKLEEEVIIEEN